MGDFIGDGPLRVLAQQLELAPSAEGTESEERDADHPHAVYPGQRWFEMVGEPGAVMVGEGSGDPSEVLCGGSGCRA